MKHPSQNRNQVFRRTYTDLFNNRWTPPRFLRLCGVIALLFISLSVQAVVVGPYTRDSNTLHLWHLDETAVPAVDSAPGGTNLTALGTGASLNLSSFSGFGTALSSTGNIAAYLAPRTLANGTGDDTAMSYADTTTGAFTYELVVRVDFDPATFNRGNAPLYLMTAENETGNRPWQFRIHTNGVVGSGILILQFLNIGGGGGLNVPIPITGPDAIAQGNWYHVAVTFTGAAAGGQIKLYWTLMDPSRTQANEIGSGTTGNLNPIGTGSFDFSIGNVGRTTPNGNFVGLIDEVRLSKVARSSTEMMFTSLGVSIVTQPGSQTNAIGQPSNFSVSASGAAPLSYQWFFNGLAIPGATLSSYAIASSQLTNSGGYSVVVSNNVNAVTSSVATLTVRAPVNLTWFGAFNPDWDLTSANWDSNGDNVADANYITGDNVLFDINGAAATTVNFTDSFKPSSVTVNSDVDYYFTTSGSGSISGSSGLVKQGAGTLIVDTDNTYTGPTTIQSGRVLIGAAAILGGSPTRGSLGSGPVINNAVLEFDRGGTLTMASSISGTGDIIKGNALALLLLGTNTMTGPITVNRGSLTVGPGGLGNSTIITMNGVGTGNGTSVNLRDGTVVGSNVHLSATTSLPDNRSSIISETGTNVWNGSISLAGEAAVPIIASSPLELNGTISGENYSDFVTLRGGSPGVLNGRVTLPNGKLQKTDAGVWTINSVNNTFLYLRMLIGTLRLGVNNAIPTDAYLVSAGGVFDLGGYDQTLRGLENFGTATTTIANSSTNSDSRLSIVTQDAWSFNGVIADSTAGGTRKMSLTLSGGSLTLSNTNTYGGDTTINAGTLALSGNGAISNSTPINLATGSTLDATTRNDATLTINASQVLKGNNSFNITGSLVNNGTIELKLNKTGGVRTNDNINGLTAITYGGTLKLVITASPSLTTNDTFKLFYAGGYSGSFANIVPSTPASGLSWDTSTLATDGTLRISTGAATNPTNITFAAVNGGTALQLSWPVDHLGWTLQAQTNAITVGLSTNWVSVAGSSLTNRMVMPIGATNGTVFYRLVYP